ncbi:GDSL esterase/lipase 1-like isoform X3 [Hevea brasiliensis]|uniref:GDSL esterase/lipase 1-like isoform X3 n=1 Tax=Hevea brasiliensis TaxID=3981 RepID=UPI0025F6F453|nr:GDSL esterase/lipase 1-like isoform X3 [Hevea brasiliensis]
MASSSCPFYFLFFSSCLLIPISIQSHVQSPEKHASLFIFGDSLFDSGNNNYLKNAAGRANFWPYGETFFKYPTGRFSDGRIIPDFIAEYLKLPLIPPYLQPGNHQFTYGANFASGGAGALVETYQGMEIYKIGGRKFGFLSLLDLGSIPSVRAREQNSPSGLMKEATVLAKLHNKALSNVLKKLQKELQGFKYSVFDFYTSTTDRIKHPSKYGFVEGKVACCGSGPYRGMGACGGNGMGATKEYELCKNPGEYLFFDASHPTEKFNNQIAKLMWSGNSELTRPYNLETLIEA